MSQWTKERPSEPGFYWWRPRGEVKPGVVWLHESGRFCETGDWQCPADHGFPGEWLPERLTVPDQDNESTPGDKQ